MRKLILASISSLALLTLAACDGAGDAGGGATTAPESGDGGAQMDSMETTPAPEPATPPAQ